MSARLSRRERGPESAAGSAMGARKDEVALTGLSARAQNAVRAALAGRPATSENLRSLTQRDLFAISGVGRRTLKEVVGWARATSTRVAPVDTDRAAPSARSRSSLFQSRARSSFVSAARKKAPLEGPLPSLIDEQKIRCAKSQPRE